MRKILSVFFVCLLTFGMVGSFTACGESENVISVGPSDVTDSEYIEEIDVEEDKWEKPVYDADTLKYVLIYASNNDGFYGGLDASLGDVSEWEFSDIDMLIDGSLIGSASNYESKFIDFLYPMFSGYVEKCGVLGGKSSFSEFIKGFMYGFHMNPYGFLAEESEGSENDDINYAEEYYPNRGYAFKVGFNEGFVT